MTVTPRGIRTGNPFNIRINAKNKWQGKDAEPRDDEFETFSDPIMGMRAGFVLLVAHQDRRGADTIEKMITIWAPSKGKGPKGAYRQNTQGYIDAVERDSGISSDVPIDLHTYVDARAIGVAMMMHETGLRKLPYTDAQIDAALRLAGIKPPEKGLRQSRIGRGAAVAVGTGATTAISAAAEQIEPYVPIFTRVTDFIIQHPRTIMLAVGAVLVAIGIYTAYARWDMRRKGIG